MFSFWKVVCFTCLNVKHKYERCLPQAHLTQKMLRAYCMSKIPRALASLASDSAINANFPHCLFLSSHHTTLQLSKFGFAFVMSRVPLLFKRRAPSHPCPATLLPFHCPPSQKAIVDTWMCAIHIRHRPCAASSEQKYRILSWYDLSWKPSPPEIFAPTSNEKV
jgi:hypothetical protein